MRKSLLNLALIGLLSCTACSSPQSKATIIQNIPLTGYKLDSELASIMVISPHAPENCALIKALSDEFVGSHNIIVHWIDDTSSTDSLFDSINQTKPSAIVLLDNSAVSLFETYQQQKPEQIHPPAVVAMTVFLELVIDGLKNATGVTYEVPGVASLTALRNVSRQPIKRVGLVFRETFQWLIDTQQTLLEKENFTLIGQKVSDFPKPSELQNALSQLQSNNIDVLWILNDIGLFDHGALEKAWMPFIYKYNYPTIVGVESFLKQSTPLRYFSHFA